jgi:ABC-type transport system involved in cytochrome c biogenesis permease subunit
MSLLFACIALFAVGGVVSLLRIRRESEKLRIAAKACTWSAVTGCIALIIWHAGGRHQWLPLDDNFEALIWLGLILALFVLYVQRRHPIGGLDWFIMPMVILLLIGAAVFGRTKPHQYMSTAWSWVHRIFSYGGAVAFAVAGCVGVMYLVANRRLRQKRMVGGPKLGNLERLEHVTLTAVTLGFALLTVGAITGFAWSKYTETHGPEHVTVSPWKVGLTAIVWFIYALVLHSPINPRFRGRKAAILSIVGCVLMLGLLVTVQLVTGK